MGIFNLLLDIERRMLNVDSEIEQLKKERNDLFTSVNASDADLKTLYLNIELKKLERMYVKRQQLIELKSSTEPVDSKLQYLQQLGKLESVNERCIQLLVKRLSEEGYRTLLKQRGFLPDHKIRTGAETHGKVIKCYAPAGTAFTRDPRNSRMAALIVLRSEDQ
ncbi:MULTISPECIES: hypothetical protein [Paenibacillus]|uniref:hypothetical protein n=1 Tax=Paenibacillus TaxID=44249 RepID=UPI00096D075A|nr:MULTISPECIES: hypothetical protein [Paenibacillus]OMD26823.1 hypothetical protein BJP48_21890 [Paenibacillus odorifer]OME15295.1 hypothetical protein BSK60_11385 [Paenibacillus odorifer]OMF89804.1 hypothetical protein BK147_24830 [Paenibacillus sp. FSL R7-0337]